MINSANNSWVVSSEHDAARFSNLRIATTEADNLKIINDILAKELGE